MKVPCLLVGDDAGNFIEIPELLMTGMNLMKPIVPERKALMVLPDNIQRVILKERIAIGYDPELRRCVQIRNNGDKAVYPVAAVLKRPYLQLLRSAFSTTLDAACLLPDVYAAIGGWEGNTFVAATEIRPEKSGTMLKYDINDTLLERQAPEMLVDTVLSYLEKTGGKQICFEITQAEHLFPKLLTVVALLQKQAQYCSLEVSIVNPLLPTENSLPGRLKTPAFIEKLCEAGAEWIGLPLNSAQAFYYDAFNPGRENEYDNLISSLRCLRECSGHIRITYLTFPGLTDHPDEMQALIDLIREFNIERVVPVSLPIDPDWYINELRLFALTRAQIGMEGWLEKMQAAFPEKWVGY